MAGQQVTLIRETPDITHQILTYRFAITGAVPLGIAQRIPLFYAEKDTIIEAAFARWGTADSNGTSMDLVRVSSGSPLSANTDITDGTLLVNASADTIRPFALKKTAGRPSQNIVVGEKTVNGVTSKGETVVLEFSAAPSGLDDLFVQLRITQRKA